MRLAAQELLVAELKNLGETGRKALVDAWSGYIPKYGDPPFQSSTGGHISNGGQNGSGGHPGTMSHSGSVLSGQQLMDDEEDDR